MNWIDFAVTFSVALLVVLIVFLRYILPRIRYRSGNKIVQAYRKKYKKKD